MTTATPTAVLTDTAVESRPLSLWRTGALYGVAAALATTVMAAAAMGADVPMEIDGEQLPLSSYAELTLVATVIGVVIAKVLARRAANPRRTFVAVTVALTVLSIVPDLTFPMTAATSVVLIAIHVVAAAVIIPALASRLPNVAR